MTEISTEPAGSERTELVNPDLSAREFLHGACRRTAESCGSGLGRIVVCRSKKDAFDCTTRSDEDSQPANLVAVQRRYPPNADGKEEASGSRVTTGGRNLNSLDERA